MDFRISDESHNLKWFSLDELAGMDLEFSMKRMVAKWQDYLRKKAA